MKKTDTIVVFRHVELGEFGIEVLLEGRQLIVVIRKPGRSQIKVPIAHVCCKRKSHYKK